MEPNDSDRAISMNDSLVYSSNQTLPDIVLAIVSLHCKRTGAKKKERQH
jgi:hypothetical protein